MGKRKRCSRDVGKSRTHQQPKQEDKFSRLPDEVLLSCLKRLDVQDLAHCESVSKKLRSIAFDQTLWKKLFLSRFEVPISNKLSQLPDQEHRAPRELVEEPELDYKALYRREHRWHNGNCTTRQIILHSNVFSPPLLSQIKHGIIYGVNSTSLCVWSVKAATGLLAKFPLDGVRASCGKKTALGKPTSIAVEPESPGHKPANMEEIFIGFDNGAIIRADYCTAKEKFARVAFLVGGTGSTALTSEISQIVRHKPFCMALDIARTMYILVDDQPRRDSDDCEDRHDTSDRLCMSVKYTIHTQTVDMPVCLAFREEESAVIASIVFMQQALDGLWFARVEELRLDANGNIQQSLRDDRSLPPIGMQASLSRGWSISSFRPKSITYVYPYVLIVNRDNTMVVFSVDSLEGRVTMSPGVQLFGHTAGVKGAWINSVGKSVSVTGMGGEIRAWSVDHGRLSQSSHVKSTIVRDHSAERGGKNKLGFAVAPYMNAFRSPGFLTITRALAGFDDERIVVLQEKTDVQGEPAKLVLEICDFS